MLFTPLAPLGVGGLIASGVTGAGVTVADIVNNYTKEADVKKYIKASKDVED